jgi:hypothetical protein
MDDHEGPLLDYKGRTMFYCTRCSAPISRDDILKFGARLPDYGETADDYLDSQLLDGIDHARCTAEPAAAG